MEQVRVLILVTIMNRGGAEAMIMNYYRNIDRSRVQFDFLVHREEKGAYEDEIISLGGKIYRAMPIYPQNFIKYKKFLKNFFNEHPEYKIIHSHMSELGYFAFKEAKKHNVPCTICHAHGAPSFFDYKAIIRECFKILIRKYTTHSFMCSKEAGKWLFGKKNLSKAYLVVNAIDSENYGYDPIEANRIRKDLGVETNFVVGHVGRMTKEKNHTFLIEIFNEIYKKNNNARLILVGDGECREIIKKEILKYGISDVVYLLGVRSDVNKLMQAMDLFLFPSLFEGLGIVLVEAQASGLQCIASSSITNEVKLTDLVNFVDLKERSSIWADKALDFLHYNRKSEIEAIKSKGYDIKSAVKWLENFYLEVK